MKADRQIRKGSGRGYGRGSEGVMDDEKEVRKGVLDGGGKYGRGRGIWTGKGRMDGEGKYERGREV